jgi:hypothetical protein
MIPQPMSRQQLSHATSANALTAPMVLVAALICGDWLMSSMMLHMFVQLPLLFAGGVLTTIMYARPQKPTWVPIIPAFVFATGIVTTWMIPRALDAAVEQSVINTIKVISLVIAGRLAARAWQQASTIVRTFVAGNTVWMSATAGMLFLDAPARLCTSYGRGEQQQVGIALIAATILGTALGVWRLSSRSASTVRE